ncbi:MAG: hypothetical protein HYY06_14285 [Deltaproteobacteria bacterium]|nr:hypothetical protein [Deltaproteobacteria bacterium]
MSLPDDGERGVGLPVYEIFPDRFARAAKARRRGPWRDWDERPESPPRGRDRFGGDLRGICEHLDHVQSLGAGALYLTPIFASSSNHGYDTVSYEKIDPELGGDRAFDALARAARDRSLGLVLDGVFNHTGCEHPWFLAAKSSRRARQRSAFHFDDGGYRAWRGHSSLPEWNHSDESVRRLLYEGPASALARWTRRGATGWRLDCASDLGPQICALIRREAREAGAVDGVTGEVMSFARDWLSDGALDGVMNYVFRGAVIALVRGEIPANQAAWVLDKVAAEYPPAGLLRSWTVVGSHDTPRLSTLLGEDPGRLRLAVTLQYAYPGTPLVYYGDEIGLTGGDDPDNRRTMPWDADRWNAPLLDLYRKLGRLRSDHAALRVGGYLPLAQPGEPEIVAFARTVPEPEGLVICVANPNARRMAVKILLPLSVPDGLPLRDLLADRRTACREGFIRLELDSWDVAFLIPEPDAITGYDFFEGLRKRP